MRGGATEVTLAHVMTEFDGQITIVVVGDIDLAEADLFSAVLFDAIGRHPRTITVDLRGVVFMDCMGLGTLVGARRTAQRAGCAFVAANVRGEVRRLMQLTGLLDVLSTEDRTNGARAATR